MPNVYAVELDVTCEEQFAPVRSAIAEKAGTLDLLVHNAGIFAMGEEGIETIDVQRMLNVFHVNAVAPAALTRALLPVLRTPGAKIVAVASGAGVLRARNLPPAGQYSYGASKAALNHIVQMLHFDLAPRGMIVVGLGPGFVLTDMTRGSKVLPSLVPEQSVGGMIRQIERLTPEQSGQFLSHDGTVCRWFVEE